MATVTKLAILTALLVVLPPCRAMGAHDVSNLRDKLSSVKSTCPVCEPAGSAGNFEGTVLAAEVAPVGNHPSTLSSLHINGKTAASHQREFLVTFGLESGTGTEAPSTPERDKVTLYTGIVGTNGTGDIWSINPLVTMAPGSGDYNAQGIELDFNNLNEHRGEAPGGGGLAPPAAYGMSVTGAGSMRSTSAYMASGPGDHPIWNRGIVFANNCVKQSTFQDTGSPDRSVDILGNPTYGIYQASPNSANFFNGKLGIGKERPASALDVVGDVSASGHLRSGDLYASLAARPSVVEHGITGFTDSDSAVVQLHDAKACQPGALLSYSLTAVGAPMPNLHVSKDSDHV